MEWVNAIFSEHPDTSIPAHMISYISMMFVVVSTMGMSLNTMPALKVARKSILPWPVCVRHKTTSSSSFLLWLHRAII